MEVENNKKLFENIQVSDIVKIKFEIPDSITIKLETKCDIKTEDVEVCPERENPNENTLIKEENSFSFAKMNHEDTRKSEPVIEEFFSVGRDDGMDEYDFEPIVPDMFERKVEFEAEEEFDFSMIEKVIVEREEERGRRRS